MKNILLESGNEMVLKENAWVAFIKSQESPDQIIDIRVYDTSPGKGIVKMVIDSIPLEHHLGDIGNCLMDWDEWTLCDVFFKIGFQYTIHKEVKLRALEELSLIKEWEPQIAVYLRQL